MSIIWWIYLKGDFSPAGVICLLIISRISCKAGLSVKGWNYLYGEFYGKSCQIDDSEILLLFYHDALYVLYNKNGDFIVIFMFLNYLLWACFLLNVYFHVYWINFSQKSNIWKFGTNRDRFCYQKLGQQLLWFRGDPFITTQGRYCKFGK